MWGKLIQLIGIPLAEKLVRGIFEFLKNEFVKWKDKRKTKKENKEKAKAVKDAKNKKERIDSFNNLN